MSDDNLSYDEIKERERNVTKDYTEKQLMYYYKDLKFLNEVILTEVFLWCLSLIPFGVIWGLFILFGFFKFNLGTLVTFFISHLLYWFFSGKKSTMELLDDTQPELEVAIEVIEEIINERKNKEV